jgi:hypothetical protein
VTRFILAVSKIILRIGKPTIRSNRPKGMDIELVITCKRRCCSNYAGTDPGLAYGSKSSMLKLLLGRLASYQTSGGLSARAVLGHPRFNSKARVEHGSVRRQHIVH